MASSKQRVFTFGKGKSEGNKNMKSLLGGKGANLAEMASIGLSVPPGLTVSTEACREYQENGGELPAGLWEDILQGLKFVEEDIGGSLGDPSKPLLLSVRSGAAISMPGMMDTVLNLGLNDEVVGGLALKSGERFAYDSYRRFLDMFGNVLAGCGGDGPVLCFSGGFGNDRLSFGLPRCHGVSQKYAVFACRPLSVDAGTPIYIRKGYQL